MITESRDPKTGVLLFDEDQDSVEIRLLKSRCKELEEKLAMLESKFLEIESKIK